MRKLIFTLIALVLFSPAANAAVKWNNSSSSNSSSNENSAAWWAKTKNMKKGFFCQDEIAKSYHSRGKKIEHVVREGILFFPREGGETKELPDYLYPCPDDVTLNHYYSRSLGEKKHKHIISESKNHKKIKSVIKDNKFLREQLKRNEVLSYLFYKDGKIIHQNTPIPFLKG